jgi:branched-chain amino acid transport system substrate-binding protein
MKENAPRRWRLAAALAAALTVGGVLAGCSSSTSSSSTTGSGSTSAPAASASSSSSAAGGGATDASACGDKPGEKATGTPIVLGSINTKQNGTDFSDIQNMTAAYFNCVNDNGGVNGHPIKYYPLTEQTNPSQIASLAKQLVTTDHVMGIVGNSSILECTIDAAYWKQQGFNVLGAGIAPECWSTPNTASVNMGPRYSSDGATDYVLSQGASKVAFDQSNVPGTDYIAAGPNAIAKAKNVQIQDFTENVPITSANAIAIKLTAAAGSNGAVVLNFTPPEALKILQAAQKLNLEDKVKMWACSTPCNTDFLAKTLGPKWENKLFVNAELVPLDQNNSDTAKLFKAILAKYGTNVSGGLGSFSQMGFVNGKIAVAALKTVTGDYTVQSVNAAFKAIKDFDTGMLCQGFTYGDYPEHIPNNMDYTVTPKNGQFVQAKGCTNIPDSDPQIAAYRQIAGSSPALPGM